MALKYIKLPLFNDSFYSYVISLEGNTYTLEFLFISRINHWVFNLKDADQNPLVLGQRLTPNTGLLQGYSIPNLSGFLYFTTQSGADPATIRGSIRQLSDFYQLFYIFDDGE